MKRETPSQGCSMSPAFLLFLAFLVLKLTNVIDWPWLWVTAPLWGGIALLAAALILCGGEE